MASLVLRVDAVLSLFHIGILELLEVVVFVTVAFARILLRQVVHRLIVHISRLFVERIGQEPRSFPIVCLVSDRIPVLLIVFLQFFFDFFVVGGLTILALLLDILELLKQVNLLNFVALATIVAALPL